MSSRRERRAGGVAGEFCSELCSTRRQADGDDTRSALCPLPSTQQVTTNVHSTHWCFVPSRVWLLFSVHLSVHTLRRSTRRKHLTCSAHSRLVFSSQQSRPPPIQPNPIQSRSRLHLHLRAAHTCFECFC